MGSRFLKVGGFWRWFRVRRIDWADGRLSALLNRGSPFLKCFNQSIQIWVTRGLFGVNGDFRWIWVLGFGILIENTEN